MVLGIVVAAVASVVYVAHLILRVILRFWMDAESASETAKWLLGLGAILAVIAVIAFVINAFEGSTEAWKYLGFVVGLSVVCAVLEWLANR